MSNINDFEIKEGILVHYNGSDAEVVIPAGVQSIGEEAFRGNESLESVTIPEGVSRIERKAFDNCHNLTSITIPNSVTSIGSGAFDDYVLGGGVKTKNIYAGDLLNYLDIQFDLAAWKEANLYFNGELATDIVIPDGVTSIGKYAFWSCKSLTSVKIPDSVTSIGDQAFDLCSKLDAVYCNSIKSWCNIAFDSNPLSKAKRFIVNGEEATDITIPDGVTSIGRYAFDGYKRLTSVTIPEGVTSIGYGAFNYCSNLSSVTIPNSVKKIENYAFCGCESLTAIDLPESLNYIGESAFSSCSNLLSITIPGGVMSISEGAFDYCRNMTSVTISEGVKRIGNHSFGDCSSLKSVMIPDSMNWFNEINYKWGNYIFHENTVVILNHYIKDIEKKNVSKRLVFCKTPIQEIKSTNAKDLAVKGFLTVDDLSIYDDSVVESYKKYLKTKAVNYIYFILENDVDMAVKRLASLDLIDNKFVEKLMEHDLADETKAFLLQYRKDNKSSSNSKKSTSRKGPSVTELKKTWSFKKNEEGLTITSYKDVDTKIIVPEMIGKDIVTVIDNWAFSPRKSGLNEAQHKVRSSIEEVVLPNTVTSINNGAFSSCCNLVKMTIPDGVANIGGAAFEDCRQLKDVTIPDSVEAIGSSAFAGCSSLESVIIPDSVKVIDSSTFAGCEQLSKIQLPNKLKEIRYDAFKKCTSLIEITIPSSVTKVYGDIFDECKSLKSVILPSGLKKVEFYMFNKCTGLTDITIMGSKTGIDETAFNGCSNFTIHAPAGSLAEKYAQKNKIPFEALDQ